MGHLRTAARVAAWTSLLLLAGAASCGGDDGATSSEGASSGEPACISADQSCTNDDACCGRECQEGTCVCVGDLHPCRSSIDCCSGVCEDGACSGGSGSCKGYKTDCDACSTCAETGGGPCTAEFDACLTPVSQTDLTGLCTLLTNCWNGCADDACLQACNDMYPDGYTAFFALYDCAICDQCRVACADGAASCL